MFFAKKIKIKLIDGGRIPEKKTERASCFDCYSNETKLIKAGERNLVNLGFALGLKGFDEAVIRPRSGLSKNAIDIAIGTIDADYTGEIKANVINNSHSDYLVKRGDRICQIKIDGKRIRFKPVDDLNPTARGDGGFGHTGL